jgi:hypothetical protein
MRNHVLDAFMGAGLGAAKLGAMLHQSYSGLPSEELWVAYERLNRIFR